MTDNGSKPCPVRTLPVKNFSVIKEAKLEFGKITVLIGPQASGKSLLCKLAFFLEKHILDIAVDALVGTNPLSLEEFANQIARTFLATRDFALELALGGPWATNPIAGEQVLESVEEARDLVLDILGGEAIGHDSSLQFKRLLDGLSIPLANISAGTQGLLPLGDVIRQLATRQRDRIIFPRKDNLPGLTEAIIESVNNLLEAFQVAAAKPEKKDDVDRLIPERYWVNPGDLKAYRIHDGKLESIMDPETGLISSNYLDSGSDTIGAEFDELLRLGYVES